MKILGIIIIIQIVGIFLSRWLLRGAQSNLEIETRRYYEIRKRRDNFQLEMGERELAGHFRAKIDIDEIVAV